MVWAGAGQRPGVEPTTPWSCPESHPIKGYVAASGARVYHVPGGRFYEEASPERCYASDDEARRDGSHPARDPRPPPPGLPVACATPRRAPALSVPAPGISRGAL
jgi:hypothetical protein